MALGILAIHDNGFFHNAFLPENILIGEEQGIEVLKFTKYGLVNHFKAA